MRGNSDEKIGSVRRVKYWLFGLLAFAFVVLILLLAVAGGKDTELNCTLSIPDSTPSRLDYLRSAEPRECIYLERVSDNNALATGLSKYEVLPQKQGMLFVFNQPESACMWMKNMKFSIDIVWLDEQGTIIQIKENVRPESYPETYCSEAPAKYVIELNSGIAKKAGLHDGQKLAL